MIKVNHISSEHVIQMVGAGLCNELWVNGMMNELRRHPNAIPCSPGEIPSMLIPKCNGPEKVEWGFTAGMSCLVTEEPGKIRIRNAEKFPACTMLALLSCWYYARASAKKNLTTTLMIPENAKEFTAFLNKVEPKLAGVVIKRKSIPAEMQQETAPRRAFSPSNSIALCQGVQGVDIGRFQFFAKCINGSFKAGDAVTITDGSYTVRAEHCPILSLSDRTNREIIHSSDDAGDDIFGAYIAVWFPNNAAFNGINIIKENPQPAFTPEKMPAEVVIAEPDAKSKGGFFQRLFGKKDKQEAPVQSGPVKQPSDVQKVLDAANCATSLDLSMKAAEKDAYPKSSEAELLKIFAEYFAPNTSFYSAPGTPAYTAYFGAIQKAKLEIFAHEKLFFKATKYTLQELADILNNPKPMVTNMVLLGLIFRVGWYCVIEDKLTCIDFSEYVPNCIALYLLLTAQKKPADKRTQGIDAGERTDPEPLARALDGLKPCDQNWNPVILGT